jgi:hypothetical protein
MAVHFISRHDFNNSNDTNLKFVSNKSPVEEPDGIRTIFTIPDPLEKFTLMVFINGVNDNNFEMFGTQQIIIDNPPLSQTDNIRLAYMIG